jgi:hypothetical protein
MSPECRKQTLEAVSEYIKEHLQVSDNLDAPEDVDDPNWLARHARVIRRRRSTAEHDRGTEARGTMTAAELLSAVKGMFDPDSPLDESVIPYDEIERLCEYAYEDPLIFDQMKAVAGMLLVVEKPLPEALRDFASRVLLGQLERPAQKGPYTEKSLLKEAIIGQAVQKLCDAGIPASRNDVSEHEDSACDIVAEALGQLGLTPSSYSSVKKAWLGQRGPGLKK